jgi:hypothetical protein
MAKAITEMRQGKGKTHAKWKENLRKAVTDGE